MTFRSLVIAKNAILLLAASSVDGHSSLIAASAQEGQQEAGDGGGGGLSYVVCPQVPTLHCRNGSTCISGMATIHEMHAHLNLQTHESGYHCVCLPGYVGHECQVEVDDCDTVTGYDPSDPTGTIRSCYHGSKCRTYSSSSSSSSSGGSSASAVAQHYCDCESINRMSGPTAQKFAGIMCQHASTSMCAASLVVASSSSSSSSSSSVGSHSPNGQFCANHGTCVRMVSGDEPHPGCVCKDGWTGLHCAEEIPTSVHVTAKMAEEEAASKKGVESEIAGNVLLGCYLVAIAAVALYIPVVLVRIRRERRNAADADAAATAGDSNSAPPVESTTTTRGAVSVEAADADGSGTLGNFSIDDGGAEDGDMELTSKEEEEEEEEDGAASVPGIV